MGKLTPAEYVIYRFGGVRKTARALGYSAPAICSWKREDQYGVKGLIPTHAQRSVLKKAKTLKLDINTHDIIYGR